MKRKRGRPRGQREHRILLRVSTAELHQIISARPVGTPLATFCRNKLLDVTTDRPPVVPLVDRLKELVEEYK